MISDNLYKMYKNNVIIHVHVGEKKTQLIHMYMYMYLPSKIFMTSGMCPAPDPEEGLHLTSTIEELKAPIPELFDVLTEEKDEEMRWTTYTYPAHYDALYFKPGHGMLDVNFGKISF